MNTVAITMPKGAQFRCIEPAKCAPCVIDSRFDPNLRSGLYDGKLIRRYKQNVSMGNVLAWVGVESRDQFVPVNKEAEKLNKLDREYLIKEIKNFNPKIKIPDDATLGELGKTFNKNDPRMKHVFIRANEHGKKKRLFTEEEPVANPVNSFDERQELKDWLDKHSVSYHHKAGLDKLKKLKENELEKLEGKE